MNNTGFPLLAAIAAFLLLPSLPSQAADATAKAATPPSAAKTAGTSAGAGAAVAYVNGEPISKAEFDRAWKAFSARLPLGGLPHGASLDSMKQQLVNQLVDRELLYQASLKVPVQDLSKKTDEQLQKIEAREPSPEAFQKQLKAASMTEKDLKHLIAMQISVRHYVDTEIAPKLHVTEADAQKFYDQNKSRFKVPEQMRASHILIRVDPKAKPAEKEKALAKAKELQKRAANGEDFAKLARENSQDPGSAKNGGDLGFFTRRQMVPAFANAAFALKNGQVSDVVETQYGYHIIKGGERKPGRQESFAEVKDRLMGYLKTRAVNEALSKKVEELKKTAKITVVEPTQGKK